MARLPVASSDVHTQELSELILEVVADGTDADTTAQVRCLLEPDAAAVFPGLAHTRKRAAATARLHHDLVAALHDTARRATAVLTRIDPRAALDQDLVSASAQGAAGDLLGTYGLHRYIWPIAAAGGGHGESRKALAEYLTAAGRWVALQQVAAMTLPRDDEVAPSIALNPHFEAVRRVASTDVRFAWVSQLLLECTAEAIASAPAAYPALTWLTTPVVDEYFAHLRLADHRRGRGGWRQASVPSEGLRRLLSGMSLPAGSLAGRDFPALMLGGTREVFPLVAYERGVFPASSRDATLAVERPFFELVRRLQGDRARGDLYEEVVARSLRAVAAGPLSVPELPLAIGPVAGDRNVSDAGQTDVALVHGPDPGLVVVGEAKSHLVSTHAATVINAFTQEVGRAVDQLDLRLGRLAGGSTLVTGTGSFTPPTGASLHGIAVPLHAYASAVLDGAALDQVRGRRHDIAVIPLHQLVLVAQTVRDAGDLERYLVVRANAIRMGVIVWDEIDLLVNHLQGWDPLTIETGLDLADRRTRPALTGRSVDPALAVNQDRPTDREEWRALLLDACRYVPPRRS
ncbi:hypothetical protein [Blastococcus sp. SYSU D00695]